MATSDQPRCTVKAIPAADTYPLRRSVLRTGTASSDVVFAGDADGFHLGAFDGDRIIGVASWLPIPAAVAAERWDLRVQAGADVVQLRGMATDPLRRGAGVGRRLLGAGIEILVEQNVAGIVANARANALEFYLRFGFDTVGAVYVDEATGLEHRRVRFELGRPLG